MRRNLLSTFLFLIAVSFFQTSLVSSYTPRKAQPLEFAGSWMLLSATKDGVVEEIPQGRTIHVSMNPQGSDAFRMNIKVANHMSALLTILGTNDEDDSLNIEVGAVSSTRMAPPPELAPMERFISSNLPALNKMSIQDGMLVMEGPNVMIMCEKDDAYEGAQ